MVDTWKLDENLRGINALCERWVGEAYHFKLGVGKLDMWRGERGSGHEGVVSDEVMMLDKVLANSDTYYRDIVRIWYAQDTPIDVKAKQIGVSRPKMYEIWRRTLEYLRGSLIASGLRI